MDLLWSFVSLRLSEFSSFEVTVLVLNTSLLLFAKPLFRLLSHGNLESAIVQDRLHILFATRQQLRELVFDQATKHNISLATPLRHQPLTPTRGE